MRIVDDELWQAVRARQGDIAEKYANVTEAVREHHKKNRLNGARRIGQLLRELHGQHVWIGRVSIDRQPVSFLTD
ncbi:hypothetical protein [Phyllobacterium phragmitis]|uniref:hypothetical protein n=1 Tax=Phyllobacterium phragmitis TaxID=2670329 RepID=UPI00315A6CD2